MHGTRGRGTHPIAAPLGTSFSMLQAPLTHMGGEGGEVGEGVRRCMMVPGWPGLPLKCQCCEGSDALHVTDLG